MGCAKALDQEKGQLCVLSASCNEPAYTKLVEALCAEHGVNLMKVSDGKQLGEWAGLAKLDKEGGARKVIGCSCVVVKDGVRRAMRSMCCRTISSRKSEAYMSISAPNRMHRVLWRMSRSPCDGKFGGWLMCGGGRS